jgi:hypothetical protein
VAIATALILSGTAWADAGSPPADPGDKAYFTVGHGQVELVEETIGFDPFPENDLLSRWGLFESPVEDRGTGPAILDQIFNYGEKIWKVVEAGKPVVQFQTRTANALPANLPHWSRLTGWRDPVSRLYRVTYRNLYGMKVVDFQYRVQYTAGGSLDGQGQYLINVAMMPASVSVAWGYEFDAAGSVGTVVNAGSADRPIGAVELLMSWTVKTVLREMRESSSFFVRGDGQFLDLTGGTGEAK